MLEFFRRENKERELASSATELSRSEVKLLVSACLNEDAALNALLKRGRKKSMEWGWDSDITEESVKRRLYESEVSNQPVCDVALVAALWCDQNVNKDRVYDFEYVINGMSDYLYQARSKNLYDDSNAEDKLAIQAIFKALVRRLPDARQANISEALASDVVRGVRRGREMRPYASELLLQQVKSSILDERKTVWEGVGESLGVMQASEIMLSVWEDPNRMDTLFVHEPISALYNILYRENKLCSMPQSDAATLKRTFAALGSSLSTWQENGHEEILYSAIANYLENSGLVMGLMPRELVDKVETFVKSKTEKKLKKTTVSAPKISVKELEKIGWGTFKHLRSVFEYMEYEDQEELLKYLNTNRSEKSVDILEEIFTNSDSKSIEKSVVVTQRRIIRPNVHSCFKEPILMKMVSTMLDHREEFLFQLGEILTMIPYRDFPEEVRVKIRAYLDETEQKIRPFHDEWYLCSASEKLLIQSLSLGAVVLINNSFVVKFTGKRTALCIRSFTDKMGATFIEGNWYSPVGADFISVIQRANKRGQVRLDVKKGEWAMMRSIQEVPGVTAQELLTEAKYLASNLDVRAGKIMGVNRDEYANNCFEVHQ